MSKLFFPDGQNIGSQICLYPHPWNFTLHSERDSRCDEVEDLEMRKLSWIIHVGPMSSKWSLKVEDISWL